VNRSSPRHGNAPATPMRRAPRPGALSPFGPAPDPAATCGMLDHPPSTPIAHLAHPAVLVGAHLDPLADPARDPATGYGLPGRSLQSSTFPYTVLPLSAGEGPGERSFDAAANCGMPDCPLQLSAPCAGKSSLPTLFFFFVSSVANRLIPRPTVTGARSSLHHGQATALLYSC
jgi:hypothetical protein